MEKIQHGLSFAEHNYKGSDKEDVIADKKEQLRDAQDKLQQLIQTHELSPEHIELAEKRKNERDKELELRQGKRYKRVKVCELRQKNIRLVWMKKDKNSKSWTKRGETQWIKGSNHIHH